MYIQIGQGGRCISACSVRQSDNDIELVDCTDEFLLELQHYVYQDGGFVKDESYAPPESPITNEDIIMLAIADLDMQRENDKTEIQLAIAELAETILGGM